MSRSFRHTLIKHIMFQSSSDVCQWRFRTKFIILNILWGGVYSSPCLLPKSASPVLGKKFPNCACLRIAPEKHSPAACKAVRAICSRAQPIEGALGEKTCYYAAKQFRIFADSRNYTTLNH